jgi:Ca2+-binding EF-hand superfamily protein
MLKDIIYNIYNSKNNFNNKCIENKQPKETMEEYMYTYFNYKYGLKNMVIEWATNIINGIKTYSYIDSEICLFGKILRNDLDESCQYIMPKIKKIVEESIIKIFKKEYGLKSSDEIIEYKNKLIKNRLPLNLVQLVLDNIYTKEEQEKLLPKITDLVNEFKNKTVNNDYGDNNLLYNLNPINNKDGRFRSKLSRIELNQKLIEKENELNSISFNELINIFHEFEINKKENYLRPFVYVFKKIDDDSDGIINENQFINLVKDLKILEEKDFENLLNELLNLIDPYGYKKIIFTDCVEVFSSYNIGNKNIFDIINNSKEKEGIDNGKK